MPAFTLLMLHSGWQVPIPSARRVLPEPSEIIRTVTRQTFIPLLMTLKMVCYRIIAVNTSRTHMASPVIVLPMGNTVLLKLATRVKPGFAAIRAAIAAAK